MKSLTASMDYSYQDDMLYFRVNKRSYADSVEVSGLSFDYDESGDIVGLELYDASKLFGISKAALKSSRSFKVDLEISEDSIRVYVHLVCVLRNHDKTSNLSVERVKPEFLEPAKVAMASV